MKFLRLIAAALLCLGADAQTLSTPPNSTPAMVQNALGQFVFVSATGGQASQAGQQGTALMGQLPSGQFTYCTTSGNCNFGGSGNPATPNSNAALAKVIAGTGFMRILANGDSTTYGYCSTGTCTTSGQSYNLFSYPHQLCSFFVENYGIKCEDDAIFGSGDGTTYSGLTDSRVTFGSSWSQDTTVASLGFGTYKATTNTNAFTFTPLSTVDTFEVYLVQDTTEGACAISVNGGSTTTVSTNGSAAFLKETYTTTAAAGNFVSIFESSGTCHLVGIVSYLSTQPSIIVMNSGAVAADVAQIFQTGKPYNGGSTSVYSSIGANLVINDIGINDWLQSTALATYSATYQAGITAQQQAGADVIIKSPIPSGTTPSNATQSTYVEAMRALAVANTNIPGSKVALPFADWWNSMRGSYANGGYTYGNGLGYYPAGNQTHNNQYGYAAMADFIAPVIIPPLSQADNEQRLNALLAGGQTVPNQAFQAVTIKDPSFGSSMVFTPGACETNYGITTLSTSSTNTFTGLSCIPANSVVMSVEYRITTTITGATSFTIGSSTGVPNKYCTTQSTLTAGTTGSCLAGWSIAGNVVAALATAPIIQTNTTATAGAMRVIVYYVTFTPPTS